MKKILVIAILILSAGIALAQTNDPVVTNVRFEQRMDGTYMVDIYYDVEDADGDEVTITVAASENAGESFNFPITAVTGDVGQGIVSGTEKHIEWDFGSEHPEYFSDQIQIKIIASDAGSGGGGTPIPGMVYVEGGTFTMGCTAEQGGDCYSNETPTHSVTLSSFYIGKYEVTQGEYESLMGTNPSRFSGSDNPVERVSWYDVVEYCNALSAAEGLEPCYTIDGSNTTCDFTKNGYRLPTEAEWEYAARGGSQSQGYRYAGSDDIEEVAWYYYNSSVDGNRRTHEVGTKTPNELGIYDMSGNVWEWCWDWYGSYSSSSVTNPTGPESGAFRVRRGGGWDVNAGYCRVANRSRSSPTFVYYSIGFRLARTE